jgi:hypothetical protein
LSSGHGCQGGGEPDVIAEIWSKDGGTPPLTLVIEAKHGASKSGGAPSLGAPAGMSENSEDRGVTEPDHSTYDQLAKYWRAASTRFSPVALIYLTHHRSLPKNDIRASLHEAGQASRIFWLSWFHLYRWVAHRLVETNSFPTSERRIIEALHSYLGAKGYGCFLGWPPFPSIRNRLFAYRHVYWFYATGKIPEDYVRTYNIGRTTRSGKTQSAHYVHTYKIDRQITPIRPLCFYQVRREDA